MTVKTVGLDLAKDVFQVHCVSATGRKIINKKIKRAKLLSFFEARPRCVVGMEACGSPPCARYAAIVQNDPLHGIVRNNRTIKQKLMSAI